MKKRSLFNSFLIVLLIIAVLGLYAAFNSDVTTFFTDLYNKYTSPSASLEPSDSPDPSESPAPSESPDPSEEPEPTEDPNPSELRTATLPLEVTVGDLTRILDDMGIMGGHFNAYVYYEVYEGSFGLADLDSVSLHFLGSTIEMTHSEDDPDTFYAITSTGWIICITDNSLADEEYDVEEGSSIVQLYNYLAEETILLSTASLVFSGE